MPQKRLECVPKKSVAAASKMLNMSPGKKEKREPINNSLETSGVKKRARSEKLLIENEPEETDADYSSGSDALRETNKQF